MQDAPQALNLEPNPEIGGSDPHGPREQGKDAPPETTVGVGSCMGEFLLLIFPHP